ncbi:uncharacterized protein NFIA_081340 [Aspergillus fischeri NRRL 181]|uniref:Uncharacterized protein n=1 Tax=Neosartorya fischeri (strain ATCC 1020 / DSM 3700 / CBS 544.65 / FGSC A1164 / JCM 1740 / NRRL 181 / WB 181) TaxID=331117 RepID=A1DFN3_NEOFI|nr:uncharacterized protein NFIA_081340 [Aspergillus fischeri NRRL 181]EAW18190.1 hypothetical protein NFIA_081340 [Aspergillus fischeri NRRL 181]
MLTYGVVDRNYLDLPNYRLPYTIDERDWDISAHWFRPGAKSPHIKVLMFNAIQGQEDFLIREEILTILGVMMQRLNTDGLEKHVVAPVMLLSFMGECHGRIAYFDGDKLVIQRSKLYRFYSGDWKSYLLFLTYLAAGEVQQTL